LKIRYTLHALERMKQRGIDKELVEECLENPDRTLLKEDTYRCIKKINDRVLVVIFRKNDDTILVITAFVSTKTHKYLG
jgi:hypothetical protein